MSALVSGALSSTSFFLDVIGRQAEEAGIPAVRKFFQAQSFGIDALKTAISENPVEAGAALVVGLTAAALLGPEIVAAGGVDAIATCLTSVAGDVISASVARSIAGSIVDSLLEHAGEDLYDAIHSHLDTIWKGLGGTDASQTLAPVNGAPHVSVAPQDVAAGAALVTFAPGDSHSVVESVFSTPQFIPGLASGSVTVTTGGIGSLTLDPGTWSRFIYNGRDLSVSVQDFGSQPETLKFDSSTGKAALNMQGGQTLLNFVGGSSIGVAFSPITGGSMITIGYAPAGSTEPQLQSDVTSDREGVATFSDALGHAYADYAGGILTGGKVKVTAGTISAFNFAGQLENAISDVVLGAHASGVVDKAFETTGNYSFTDLLIPAAFSDAGPPGYIHPSAINNAGEVVGWYNGGTVLSFQVSGLPTLYAAQTGFAEIGGSYTELNASLTGIPKYPTYLYETNPTGINSSGIVAGNLSDVVSNGVLPDQHGFIGSVASLAAQQSTLITDPSDVPTQYGAIPQFGIGSSQGYHTYVAGISDDGTIIGGYTPDGGAYTAFIDKNGVFSDVSYPGAAQTDLVAISANGTVLGIETQETNTLPNTVFTLKDGQFTTVLGLGRTGYTVTGINDNGTIVGYYVDDSGTHGFVDQNGIIATVDHPLAAHNEILTWEGTYITGVNDSGTVVGYYEDSAGMAHGFVAALAGAPGQSVETGNLEIVGAGAIDLNAATGISGVQTVSVQEGQDGYKSADGSIRIAGTEPLLQLKSGASMIVDVLDGGFNPANPNPLGIVIYGANDSDVINLAGGSDTVYLGSRHETVNGGSGNDVFYVSSHTAAATIAGGGGLDALRVAGGGAVIMGSHITGIASVALMPADAGESQAAYQFTANRTADLLISGTSGGDEIAAGGAKQVLTGHAGNDVLIGTAGQRDIFRDTAKGLDGDTIRNFAVTGDFIDIVNLARAHATLHFSEDASGTFGTLMVGNGHSSATITLDGDFSPDGFRLVSDGAVGSKITYTASSSAGLALDQDHQHRDPSWDTAHHSHEIY